MPFLLHAWIIITSYWESCQVFIRGGNFRILLVLETPPGSADVKQAIGKYFILWDIVDPRTEPNTNPNPNYECTIIP